MTKFDNDLGAALAAEDREFLEDLENGRGLFDQLGATMQGPMRFWTYLMGIFTFVFFGLAVYCAWMAVEAIALRETILWSAAALWCALAVAMLKLWLWERMNLLSLLTELKKLELRVAQLSDRQG